MPKIGKIQIPPIVDNTQAQLAIQNTFNSITSQLDNLGAGTMAANYTARTIPPTAAFSNQKYSVGDIVRNSNPTYTSNGTIAYGWMCVVAGSPGQWVEVDFATTSTLSGRNKIINGNCAIAQRPSLSLTSGVSGYAGPDRFVATNNGAGGAFTQSLGSMTVNGVAKPCVQQQVTTALTNIGTTLYWGGISQRIEGVNCNDLLGMPVTLSFWFNSSISGTFGVSIQDGSTNSYLSTFSVTANIPQKVVITTPPLGTNFNIPNTNGTGMIIWIGALNNGAYNSVTNNQWVAGNFISTTVTDWGLTVGAVIQVAELQLEAGVNASTFERESYTTTLNKCYRYYTNFGGALTPPLRGVITGATSAARCAMPLIIPMRSTPTVTMFGNPNVYDGTATTTVSAIAATYSSPYTLEMDLTLTSFTTAAGRVALLYQGAAAGFNLSAEL